MTQDLDAVLSGLPRYRAAAADLREILLANLVMIAEVPSPTFGEERRVNLVIERLGEAGLNNTAIDEKGNGFGVLPGLRGDRNILLVAHADTPFDGSVDHTISLRENRVRGPGVADNSLGVAALASLPTLLERLDIQLDANIIFMAASRSLGRGNLEGLRFFLGNADTPIRAGVCLEGIQIGRLSHSAIGMLRGEISCTVPEEYDWIRFGATSAIATLNMVINRIYRIPVPRQPLTMIVVNSIRGGTAFSVIARQAVLRFEIRSESGEIVHELGEQFEDIVAEVRSQVGADVTLDIFAHRQRGGIAFTHPLVHNTRAIIRALEIESRVSPSISELSAFIDRQIPAITVGVTTGERQHELDEAVAIEPMFRGMAQVVGILLAIDGGHCDES